MSLKFFYCVRAASRLFRFAGTKRMPALAFACTFAPLTTSAPAQTPPTAEAGAEVYALRCSPCHGVDLNNTSGGQVFDLRRLRPTEHDRFVEFGDQRQG